jgi:hypothetical protein
MSLNLAYRLKTFGLTAAILVGACAAASAWLDGAAPMAPADSGAAADLSSFVQSGGLVPDA